MRAARYLTDALRGVRQAPVEVIATMCVALVFSWALETGDDAMQTWAELAVACVLLFAFAWTGTLLHALGRWNATSRWTVTVLGAAVVAAYAFTLTDFEYEAERWRALLLVAAAALWVVALPAFGGAMSGAVERMRRVDGRIVLRMVGALLYGVALFAGLALAFRAVTVLFELEPHNEIYGHVWGWIFFVLVPWIVLGGLPDYVRPADAAPNQVARVAHRIALYLVPPLLALYGLILYAYVIRILITAEVPKNLVSPLVLAAGLIGAVAMIVFDPRPGGGPLARSLRLAPALFLPLVPLGAWAVVVRVQQYGWTEFRHVRLAVVLGLALLAVAAVIQVVRRRPLGLHAAPVALAVILLLSALGPWSALAVSRASQQALLGIALEGAGIPQQDSTYATSVNPDSARVIAADAYEQIRGSAQYLARHFGADALPPALATLGAREDGRWLDYPAELGLRPDAIDDEGIMVMGGSLPAGVAVALAGGTAYRIDWTWTTPGRFDGRPAPARAGAPPAGGDSAVEVRLVRVDSSQYALRLGDRTLRFEAGELLGSLGPRTGPQRGQDALRSRHAVLPLMDSTGVQAGELLVWHVLEATDSTGTYLQRFEGLVLLRQ